MPDLNDGESIEMQGSGSKPYVLKNVGGVYSCTCPAWRNQSLAIELRTCKHLRKLRGDAAEEARIGGATPVRAKANAEGAEKEGPPLLLAERWDRLADLSGWWMSEKLDGVRAYWDGKQFLSRLGNLYHAPDWFIEGLPDVALDGELWIDRKMFQRTVSIVRRQDKNDLWREVRYLVFDAPAHGGHFEQRLTFFHEILTDRKPPFAAAHPHSVCKNLDHLHEELARIEALGGEGLMLRQPRSKYEIGRSSTLLKVKSFLDAEGRVIGHKAGAAATKAASALFRSNSRTARASMSAPASPTPSAQNLRPSAVSSRSAIKNYRRPVYRAFRRTSAYATMWSWRLPPLLRSRRRLPKQRARALPHPRSRPFPANAISSS